ncbi:Hsp70 family protein [Nocardia sp. NPDC055321]
MSRSIGIDLGGSKALVAVVEGGRATVLPPSGGAASLLRAGRAAEADVLSALRRDAEQHLGQPVTQAVVSSRAAGTDAGRRRLELAAESAGFTSARVVSPTAAAALQAGITGPPHERTVLILDLGRDGCEVAVVEIGGGVVEMRSVRTDPELGGRAWDRRIADRLAQGARHRHGIDPSADEGMTARLLEAAEAARITLSSAQHADITVPYLATDAAGQLITLTDTLTRSEYERYTADLVERCRALLRAATHGLVFDDLPVHETMLVGSGSRMPSIEAMIREETGCEPNRRILAEHAAVEGAAVLAAVLRGEIRDLLLLDTVRHSIGIEVAGGGLVTLVERDTTIPIKRTTTFTTVVRDQKSALIRVFEGEQPVAVANNLLGELRFTDVPPGSPGEVSIEVTCDIYMGSVHVSVRAPGSEREQTLRTSGLTPPTENRLPGSIESVVEYPTANAGKDAGAETPQAPAPQPAPQRMTFARGFARTTSIVGAILFALGALALLFNMSPEAPECDGNTMRPGDVCEWHSTRTGAKWDTSYEDEREKEEAGTREWWGAGRSLTITGLVLLTMGGVAFASIAAARGDRNPDAGRTRLGA